MKKDTVDFTLPPENTEEMPRDCHMSQELFQNARLTMGELRDFMRVSGISWEALQKQIERAKLPGSPIEKAMVRMDDYSTGIGKSLHDKESNLGV